MTLNSRALGGITAYSLQVVIIGAGCSGLCAGYELKKAGFDVQILEASSRVGGRVITFRDPYFAPGLHGEGGAMRIPKDHLLLLEYIKKFGLEKQLFDFEMRNKFIYLSGLGKTVTYDEFDKMLKKLDPPDPELMKVFPNLTSNEKGKTCDELFEEAVQPVVDDFWKAYDEWLGAPASDDKPDGQADGSSQNFQATTEDPKKKGDRVKHAYAAITKKYDKYSLRSYLTEVAGWSQDAINLYDLGNAHVVFENGFIESWKDAFLSSNGSGAAAGMKQLGDGMDQVPKAFIRSKAVDADSLIDNITFGARVKHIERDDKPGFGQTPVKVLYENPAGEEVAVTANYLILAIPYTSQRSITKSHPFVPKQEMAIRLVRYVEVTKVLLQYIERWWKNIFTAAGQGTDGGLVSDLPIRYTMFPKEDEMNPQIAVSNRGVVMAAYTFEQDATILGSLSSAQRIAIAARNLATMFPQADSLSKLEAYASQVFPADEMAGGSAFCYFGPMQKTDFLETMIESDWDNQVFFAGEQASYTHGWIQGAFEAGLRCAKKIYEAAKTAV